MKTKIRIFIICVTLVFTIVFFISKHYLDRISNRMDSYANRMAIIYITHETLKHTLYIQRELIALHNKDDEEAYKRIKSYMNNLKSDIEALSSKIGYIYYMGLSDELFRVYAHHVGVLEMIVPKYLEAIEKFISMKGLEERDMYWKRALDRGKSVELFLKKLDEEVKNESVNMSKFLPTIISRLKWMGIINGIIIYGVVVTIPFIIFTYCPLYRGGIYPVLKKIREGRLDFGSEKFNADPCTKEIISTVNILVERLKEAQKSLEALTIIDPLTEAFNRRYFDMRIDEEMKRSIRYGAVFALSIIDIDHFKTINDTYGHQVGDIVLKEIVMIIKANTRETDIVARYGGEEFAIIYPNTSKTGVLTHVERLRKAVENHKFLDIDRQITISIGVSDSAGKKDYREIIKEADNNLYIAKNTGRNKCVIGDMSLI